MLADDFSELMKIINLNRTTHKKGKWKTSSFILEIYSVETTEYPRCYDRILKFIIVKKCKFCIESQVSSRT